MNLILFPDGLNKYLRVFALTILLVYLFSCAEIKPPGGGPEDTIPPEIVKTSPHANQILVLPDTPVEITFSEPMNRESVEKRVIISPFSGRLSYSWNGNRLNVVPENAFDPDRTYTFIIESGFEDFHGAKVEESFTLGFSTGQTIDTGRIQGTVYENETPVADATVHAFDMSERDSLVLAEDTPDYVVKTDQTGSFTINYLKATGEAKYRIFAFQDKNKNEKWDFKEEPMGGLFPDPVLSEKRSSMNEQQIFLASLDLKPPAIEDAKSTNKNEIKILFSEQMDPASLKNIHCYKIIHKQTEVLLDVKNAMTLDTDSKFVILSTSSQEPGANYEVSVAGVKDISGVIIDPTKSKFPILGRGEADTIPPVLYPPCRIIGTENFSKREPIKLIFSEIMDTSSTKGNVPVKVIDDSAKIPLQGKCRCKSLWEIEFTPLSDYQSLTSYTVVIDSMLSDLHGNRLPKSERIIPFKTPDYFLMGSIEGSIQCSSSENQVVIELKKNEKIVRNLASKCGGQYEITDIALVSYLVKAFVDLNRNGTWDPPDFRGANPGEPIKFKNVEFLEESGIKSYTLNFVFELQEENLGDE